MNHLIRAETNRWLSRRGLWLTLLAATALVAMVLAALTVAARPPSGADVEQGRRYYAEAHADWVANGAALEKECRASVPADQADQTCSFPEPTESMFVPQPLVWDEASTSGTEGAVAIGALFALLMAASFWGGEYRQGTLSTWLTFVPSRPRVWASKMLVAAGAGAVIAAALGGVALVGAWLAVWFHQGAGAIGSWADALALLGRGVGLGAMLALVGASLAVWFRNTIAAVAVPMAYLLLQGMMGLLSAVPGFVVLSAFLPEHNVRAYLENGATYYVPVERVTPDGTMYEHVERSLSLGQGVTYLLVISLGLTLLSFVLFHRRDVTE